MIGLSALTRPEAVILVPLLGDPVPVRPERDAGRSAVRTVSS